MSKSRNLAKPICHACHRPFDPRSPGATLTMGPTCARRAVYSQAGEEAQLSLGNDLGTSMKPEPSVPSRLHRSVPRRIPARLREDYVLAKLAFDDLLREFYRINVPSLGGKALRLERALIDRRLESYSLSDPSLNWLEPEHDLCLYIDHENETAYCRRTVNGVVTIIETDPSHSASARANIEAIIRFAKAVRSLRQDEEAVQLSLLNWP